MELYNVGTRVVNTYLYQIEDSFVMIDTGYEHGFAHFKKSMAAHNLNPKHIKYLFLTHAHDDHAGFLNGLLSKYPGVQVILSAKALPVLRKGQNPFSGGCAGRLALSFCYLMKLLGRGAHKFPPIEHRFLDRLIAVTEENRPALEAALHGKICDTPGHTADSISLLIGNKLFCGDAAMNGFPSLHRVTIWIEDKKIYRDSWAQMLSLGVETLYPGHSSPFPCRELEKKEVKLEKRKLFSLRSPG